MLLEVSGRYPTRGDIMITWTYFLEKFVIEHGPETSTAPKSKRLEVGLKFSISQNLSVIHPCNHTLLIADRANTNRHRHRNSSCH